MTRRPEASDHWSGPSAPGELEPCLNRHPEHSCQLERLARKLAQREAWQARQLDEHPEHQQEVER
jgi:hypothetical protein